MSSFLCDQETLANAASALHLSGAKDDGESYLELAYLNANGYEQRYAHLPEVAEEVELYRAEAEEFSGYLPNRDNLRAYLALRCVLYQASEGDVPDSELYAKWSQVSDNLAHEIASEEARKAGIPWG